MVLLIWRTKLKLNSLQRKIKGTQGIIASLNLGNNLTDKITAVESVFLKAREIIIENDILKDMEMLMQFREELMALEKLFMELDRIAIVHTHDDPKVDKGVSNIKDMAKEARGTISIILRDLPARISEPQQKEVPSQENADGKAA